MKTNPILLIPLILCPLVAAQPTQIDEETRRERDKEAVRAREAAARLEDREDFEKKYERIKNDFPELYTTALGKQMEAARSWRTTAGQIARSTSRQEMTAAKIPAQKADDDAEIARLEMRAAAAENDWKNSVEKSKSREKSALAEQLVQNQKTIIETTKLQKAKQQALRQLEWERSKLDLQWRETLEQERHDAERKNNDRRPARDSKDRNPPEDKMKPDGKRPSGSNVE